MILKDIDSIFDILPKLWEHGYETKKQDGEWWLFKSNGDGFISGNTFRELCINIVRLMKIKEITHG